MRGIVGKRWVDDVGMTLIEIIIAAAILFIILTGVLGLIGQTTLISAQAKEIIVANNAVAGYVEWVRSLSFDAIAISGETTAGVLAAVETTTTGEYTITIEPTIEDGTNAALKEVTMRITVARADGVRESYETMVIIRDKDQFITQSNQDPALAPKVAFVAPTPPTGALAYDDLYLDSAGAPHPFSIGFTAKAGDGRLLEQITVWCDDTYVLENSSADRADWILDTPLDEWALSPYFTWYTRQKQTYVDENGAEYTVDVIKDGKRSLVVYARDNNGDVSYQTRQFFVDNFAPDNPESPVATVQSATLANIDWPATSDGTDPAHHYYIRLYQQKSLAEFQADNSSFWREVTVWPVGESKYPPSDAYEFDWATPMSRYYARVKAASPRPLYSAAYGQSQVAFVTRPRVAGTYTVAKSSGKYTTTVNATVTPPTFFTVDPANPTVYQAPKYDWYWRYTVDGTVGHYLGTSPTLNKTFGPRSSSPYIMDVWCVVSYTPAGSSFGGLTAETKTSNKVTTGPDTITAAPFAEGVWTW